MQLLNGEITFSEASPALATMSIALVAGVVVGYAIARSTGLIGGKRGVPRNIMDLLGPDGVPLRHSPDPGLGKCPNILKQL